MMIDCHNRFNRWVSKLSVCQSNDNQELIGWWDGCFRKDPWPERGSCGEQRCFPKELNRKHHSCCSTHTPPIELCCQDVHAQCLCNIPWCVNLTTAYSFFCVPQDILSYPYYDLSSHGSIRRWASIQYPSIWACNNERRDVCNWCCFFSTWLVWWIKGVVKHHSLWRRNAI